MPFIVYIKSLGFSFPMVLLITRDFEFWFSYSTNLGGINCE